MREAGDSVKEIMFSTISFNNNPPPTLARISWANTFIEYDEIIMNFVYNSFIKIIFNENLREKTLITSQNRSTTTNRFITNNAAFFKEKEF